MSCFRARYGQAVVTSVRRPDEDYEDNLLVDNRRIIQKEQVSVSGTLGFCVSGTLSYCVSGTLGNSVPGRFVLLCLCEIGLLGFGARGLWAIMYSGSWDLEKALRKSLCI